jgi:hypothetical protein
VDESAFTKLTREQSQVLVLKALASQEKALASQEQSHVLILKTLASHSLKFDAVQEDLKEIKDALAQHTDVGEAGQDAGQLVGLGLAPRDLRYERRRWGTTAVSEAICDAT